MTKVFYLLIVLISIQFSYGQRTSFDFYRDIKSSQTLQLGREGKVDVSDIKGSPFLNDEFTEGHIYDSSQDLKSELYLRYDVFNDVIEILPGRNASSIKKLKRTTNFEYFINGEKFVLIQAPSVINKNQYVVGNGYVSEIKSFSDELTLYKRYMKVYKPGKKAETMYDKDKPAYLKDQDYYILKDGNSFKELELNKRRVLDAFPSNTQNKLKRFMKSNNIKFRGDDKEVKQQVIDLITYYYTLKS